MIIELCVGVFLVLMIYFLNIMFDTVVANDLFFLVVK